MNGAIMLLYTKNNEKKIIILFYNRFFDPHIHGNFWVFLEDYIANEENNFLFHIVTYEDTNFPLTIAQRTIIRDLKKKGVEWTGLKWHSGANVHSKLLDISSGFYHILKLRLRGYKHIIAYNSVAGSYAYIFARLLDMKLYLYTYEPHSEYSVDNGMLSSNSAQYKILHFLEKKSAHFAKVISSGTCFMQQRLEQEWKVKEKYYKIPSVTNSKKFTFNLKIREQIRSELSINPEQSVLFYPGKFGSLYYREEIAMMYRWLLDLESDLHFLIVSPQSSDEIHVLFQKAKVPRKSYTIRSCEYDQVQNYFFAADFAVIAVPPGPSKCFISNIKVGEYLCAGLPFLITRGVSEDYLYAENKKVGVVVGDFKEDDIKTAWPEIKYYLDMPPEVRREHCREVGLAYRGFESLNPTFKAAISHLMSDGN